MKTLKTILYLYILAVMPLVGFAQSGTEIMSKVYSISDGDSRKQTMTIIKTNKRGRTREEKILIYSKDYLNEKKTMMYTLEPADVRGIRFLSWEYNNDAKDDDRWLYMPAMKKIRRITSASSKQEYFFGTDFTFDDLSERKLSDDEHKYIKDENIENTKCWVVESKPTDPKSMYSKKISWIAQSNNFPLRVEFYDKMNNLLKTLSNTNIENISGIWICKNMKMVNHQTEHQTVLMISDASYNLKINEYLFTVPALEEGRIE